MERIREKNIPRQESLINPAISNPFIAHLPEFTLWDKFQLAFMSVTVFPIRLFLITICLILCWIVATIALYGRKDEEKSSPLCGWRNMLRPAVVFWSRAVFFVGGFHWVQIRGERASPREAPVIALAPHSSYLDALPAVILDLSSMVAKANVADIPIFGKLTEYTQPVYVQREDPNSRQNTILEIKRRAASGGQWPQVLIFPEGTCTNRSCLITFKPGAFIPAVPVQPVTLKYTNKYDTTTWTWEGPGALTQFFLTLCQFNNKLEIEYLPVYVPNEEEKKNPNLFARNVREKMAQSLGVPVTDHTYEDCRLMAYASKLNLPCASVLVEFQKLNRKLGVDFESLQSLLEKFSVVAQQSRGEVTLEQFADHLDVPVSPALRDMFELYDRNNSGTIDFREYVIGLHLIARPANTESTLQLAFKVFDHGDKGFITKDELADVLDRAFGMDDEDVHTLFSKITKQNPENITFDEFKAYAQERPEYAVLFTAYNELKDSAQENSAPNVTGSNSKTKAD